MESYCLVNVANGGIALNAFETHYIYSAGNRKCKSINP